ncbi:hypothetical protein RQN31_13205 [Citrobacter freundii]|nr:hypothetical protein [Citrobacter freundii]
MTSREKFEAWYLDNWGHTEDDHETLFERDPDSDEDYYRLGVRLAHEAWQAAELASEQKLTDMAVQLANAESKCRELAAEVQAVRWACCQVYMKGYNHGHLNTVDGLEYASDTELVELGGETLADFTDPDHCGVAADAILAEVRAQESKRVYESILDNPAVTDMGSLVDWLEQNANDSVEFAAQLRKGAAL